MHKLIIFILISFLYTNFLPAEVINKIKIKGNKRVGVETIKIYGDIVINKNYSEQDLNKILNNLYSTNFFEDVNINLTNGVLTVKLKEYPVINQLIILGEPSTKYKEQIQKIISLKEKDSFIKNNLLNDIEIIKSLYNSSGYNFVDIKSKIKKIDENNLDLVFDINKGEVTKITKISFTGDKKIRERRLRDVIASEEDKFWKFISKNTRFNERLVNLDIRLLKNYYKSMGYYDVDITSNSAELNQKGNVQLMYSINAGKRYVIKKIITDVDPVFDKNLFYSLNKKYSKIIGDYYSPFKIKKLLEEIDDLIAKNDLQFVEHNVEEIFENDSITIKFNIYEGAKVLVERINIIGNNITNEDVIRAELLVDEGDPFTKLNLDKSIAKIKSRNIFKTVKTKISEGTSSDLKVIEIKVEEKATGEISAGAGIGTNGGSMAFTIKENNWLGEGKNVIFDAEITKESLRGTVNYADPNYDFLGNSINYSFGSIANDKPESGYENTLVNIGASTGFEQYKDIFATLGLSASHDDMKTESTASESLKKQGGQFSELAAHYGFSYDRRDRSFKPTNGSIILFNQTVPIIADKSIVGNALSTSVYKSFSEDIIGATKFSFQSINGLNNDNVRLSKRVNISASKLRGFQKGRVGPKDGKDHIGGNYATALNFEASLPKLLPESTNTDLGLFLDFANVWGVDYDSSINDGSKLRSSVGAAASWLSPLGPMTFILSTNIAKSSTDETESFNFNLGTTF